MDAELTAFASTVATSLVGALAKQAWESTRDAVAAIWRRRHPELAASVATNLSTTHFELSRGAGPDRERQLVDYWRDQLAVLIRTDPAGFAELRGLLQPAQPAAVRIGDVTISGVTNSGSGTMNVGGQVVNNFSGRHV